MVLLSSRLLSCSAVWLLACVAAPALAQESDAAQLDDIVVTGNTVIDALLEAVEHQVPFEDERLAALQASGRRVVLDPAALGFGVTVFLGIKLAAKGRTGLEDFERAVTAIPEVQLVQHVLGQFDYRLRITARDISDFERILRRRIMTLPGVGQVEANVMLSEERRPGPLGA